MSPASSPCWLRVYVHVAPTEPTSTTDGSALISPHTPATDALMMSGTVMPMSLPNSDW